MKKQISRRIKNKTPFAFIIKMLILIGVSYLLIQLSNKEKSKEETKYIPGMQNTLDYAEHYITWKYGGDWQRMGYIFDSDGSYSLKPRFDSAIWGIWRDSEVRLRGWFDEAGEKMNVNYGIRILYGKETPITVTFLRKEEDVSYQILYEDGQYVSNLEMEQSTGVTTDEILDHAGEMCASFEAELQKMHELQLEKVRKRRKNLTNVGFIMLALYMFLKWGSIMIEHSKEDKPIGQCLDGAIVKTVKRFVRWKYVLYGAVIMFWVYILRPVVSGLILSGVERKLNIYLSYGISAIIVAAAGCFIIMRNNSEKSEKGAGPTVIRRMVRMTAGCILEMFIIRLGMILVSDFYPRTIQFYIVNGVAWCGAAFLIFVFSRIKCRISDSRKNKFYN